VKDPWAVLGVAPTASDDEIHDAYRRLATRHHPDRPGGDADRMAQINAAYALVRDGAVEPVAATRPAAPAATPVVEAAGSGRPLGCAVIAALALVVLAATIGGAIVVSSSNPNDRTATAAAPAVETPTSRPEPPPWSEARVPGAATPLAVSVWRRSPVAARCPLLVPFGADRGGTARVLDVPGGWGVAWGRPGGEDEFGIAARTRGPGTGSGTVAASLSWRDDSQALLYRDGDRLVADLRVSGVDCFYEVFSTTGFHNLAGVLGALRWVDV